MHKSFISEHTAEFILLPNLLDILSSVYKTITPLYFWTTREGGMISRKSFQNKEVKVIVFYPRRPKVENANSGIIQVKFNELLYKRSLFYQSKGITVLTGIPLADSLDKLSIKTPCFWFDLNPEESETIFDIDLKSYKISNTSIKRLLPNDILKKIDNISVKTTWTNVIQIIREASSFSQNESGFWSPISGDLYKPTYLILHLD